MRDKIGKIPDVKTRLEALDEILFVASDKRAHLLLDDYCRWLELKLKVIKKLAKKGLKANG